MSIKQEWNRSADAWLDFVRTGKDHCRYFMNNPGMFKILGNIRGKKILDLACGEGFNTRIIAKKGARVIGIDFSKEQIRNAIKAENKNRLGITYYVCNAVKMDIFPKESFDIVISFMTIQDIASYKKALKEANRVLKKNGRLVIGTTHPCFEKTVYKDGKYFRDERYFKNKSYKLYWKMKRLTKHFTTTSFHRTLTEYSNAFYSAGFVISRILEPQPTKKGLRVHPNLKEQLLFPQSIILELVKK